MGTLVKPFNKQSGVSRAAVEVLLEPVTLTAGQSMPPISRTHNLQALVSYGQNEWERRQVGAISR